VNVKGRGKNDKQWCQHNFGLETPKGQDALEDLGVEDRVLELTLDTKLTRYRYRHIVDTMRPHSISQRIQANGRTNNSN
jgi:hypothetical protein